MIKNFVQRIDRMVVVEHLESIHQGFSNDLEHSHIPTRVIVCVNPQLPSCTEKKSNVFDLNQRIQAFDENSASSLEDLFLVCAS
jgi:hypothetical protein